MYYTIEEFKILMIKALLGAQIMSFLFDGNTTMQAAWSGKVVRGECDEQISAYYQWHLDINEENAKKCTEMIKNVAHHHLHNIIVYNS